MTTTGTLNWRDEFRLHTLDLNNLVGGGEPHWILQIGSLRDMIATLEKEYQKLCAVGGDPFGGYEITPDAVIAKLGYTDSKEPTNLFASLKFTGGFVAACLRETTQVQAQTSRLRRLAPRKPRWWS